MQQRALTTTMTKIVHFSITLRHLKKFEPTIMYTVLHRGCAHSASILVFFKAGKYDDHGQTSVLPILFFEKKSSLFHVLSLIYHMSERSVKAVNSTQILTAGYEINEGKLFRLAMTSLLSLTTNLMLVVDSRDLFNSLLTCRNSAD